MKYDKDLYEYQPRGEIKIEKYEAIQLYYDLAL